MAAVFVSPTGAKPACGHRAVGRDPSAGRKRRLAILTGHDVNVHGTDDAPTATAGKRFSSISRHSDTMVRAQL